MHHLRFRQVHLDFHTSPDIPGIGEKFDRKEWQERLKKAHVDSITCFSACHHGWSYPPTKVGAMHPHLKFNLLREQMDAAKEIDVKVPVYVTAGFNYRISQLHPEWNEYSHEGKGPEHMGQAPLAGGAVTAGDDGVHEHPLAHFEGAGIALGQGLYGAQYFMAENGWHSGGHMLAPVDDDVGAADAGQLHLDEGLVLAGHGHGYIAKLQVQPIFQNCCFHFIFS